MWSSWPVAAAPAAPPLPPTTTVTQPPAPLIGPSLPPASTGTTPVVPAASAVVAAGPIHSAAAAAIPAGVGTNPYAQYTAAQYAAMTPEQQYAIQQHWQQWQAYEQQYAQWHAQYGEQYKREMQAMASVPPAPLAAYTATLPPMTYPPPTAVPIPAPPPTAAYQTQPPPPPVPSDSHASLAQSASIAGLSHIYQQPPPPPPPPQESTQSMNVPPPPIIAAPPNVSQYQAQHQYPPPAMTSQQHMFTQQPPPPQPHYPQNYSHNASMQNHNQPGLPESRNNSNSDSYQNDQNFNQNQQNQNRLQSNRPNNRNQPFGRNQENFPGKDFENQNDNNINQGYGNKPNWRGNSNNSGGANQQRGRSGMGRFSDRGDNNEGGGFSDGSSNRDGFNDNRNRNNSFDNNRKQSQENNSPWGNSGGKNYDNSQNVQPNNFNQQQNVDISNKHTSVRPRKSIQDLDEKLFDEQFRQWEEQFENWKKENANHPDKAMYMQYEREFEKARRRIMERREQMRRRKAQQNTSENASERPDKHEETQAKSQQPDISHNENQQDTNEKHKLFDKQQQESGMEVVKQQQPEKEHDKEDETDDMQIVIPSEDASESVKTQSDAQDIVRPKTTGKRKSRFEAAKVDDDVIILDNSPQVAMSELFKKTEGIPGLDLVLSKEDQECSSNTNADVIDLEQEAGPTRPPKIQPVTDNQATKKIPSLLDIVVQNPCSNNSAENQRVASPTSTQSSEKMLLQSPSHGSIKSGSRRSPPISPAISINSMTANTQHLAGNPPDLSKVLQNPNFVQVLSAALAQIQGPNNLPANVAPDQILQTLAPLLQQNVQQSNMNVNQRGGNMGMGCVDSNHPNWSNQNYPNAQEIFSNRQPSNNAMPWGKGNDLNQSTGNTNFNNPFRKNDRSGNNNNRGHGGNDFGPPFGPKNPIARFDEGGGGVGGVFGDFNRGLNFNENDRNHPGQDFGFGGDDRGPPFGGNNRGSGFGNNDRGPGYGGNEFGDRFGENDRNFGNNRNNRFGGNERDGNFGNNNNFDNFRNNFGGQNDSFNSPFGPSGSGNRSFNEKNNFGFRGAPGSAGDFGRFDNNGPPSSGNMSNNSIRGDDYFRPTQVIDYQNRSNPAKIVDYGHRPSSGMAGGSSSFENEFIPMKTIDYGHASNTDSPGAFGGAGGGNMQQMQTFNNQQQEKRSSQQSKQQQLSRTPDMKKHIKEDENRNYDEENSYPNCKWILLNPECRNRPGRPTKRGPRTPLHPKNIQSTQQGANDEKLSAKPDNQVNTTEYDEMSNNDETDDMQTFQDISATSRDKSESPPPPPSFRLNFDEAKDNGSGKMSTKSIFPSTASANEKNEKNDKNDVGNAATEIPLRGNSMQMVFPSTENRNTIPIDEILLKPGRLTRPKKIVIILRGPPGSGKSHVAKLIKDKEIEIGGSSPRLLSIDDYFMIENDYEEKCEKTGRKIPKKEILYEYEKEMEDKYMQYLIKSFKKTISDNLYDFIIVDCVNSSLRTLNEFYNHSKEANYTPYTVDLICSLETCLRQNIHKRSENDIREVIQSWNETPFHYIKVDVSNLLENVIEMEDVSDMEEMRDDDETIQEDDSNEASENADSGECIKKSKWETDTTSENLARLDGINKPLAKRSTQTLEDYLQIDGWEPTKYNSTNGKKRVRWADIEEKREQEKMRAIGFVVGQTDWNRMMDPSGGSSALTKTKYIERINMRR